MQKMIAGQGEFDASGGNAKQTADVACESLDVSLSGTTMLRLAVSVESYSTTEDRVAFSESCCRLRCHISYGSCQCS